MAKKITCPKCDELTKRAGYRFKGWRYVAAIAYLPWGLSVLNDKRLPTTCQNCGHTWQA